MRQGGLALFLAAGAMVLPAAASAQAVTGPGDVLGTVTSTTDAVLPPTETVTSVVGTVTSAVGDAGTAVPLGGGVVGPVSSSAGLGGTESSSSDQPSTTGSARSRGGDDARSRRSPGRGYDSRFDRLPRRFEVLLERIELGRHVRANLRRLRSLLASRPGREDAVLHALRAELRDLRKGGLSPSERKKAARLRAVQRALVNEPNSASSPTSEAPRGLPAAVATGEVVEAGSTGADDSGVLAARTAHAGDEAGANGASGKGPLGSFLGLIPRPGGGDSGSWLDALVLGMVWAFVVALLAIMGREVLRGIRAG